MSALDGMVVRRSTTAQQVADGLSERILAGAFPPGDRLRESAIAAELKVARNTVREAVRILELSGLVRYEVNRGAVVISPTPENVGALYTARERLETTAVSRIPTTEQLTGLGDAFDVLAQAAGSRDPRRIVKADMAFHTAIVAMLDSSRLEEFYAELTRELRFYLMVLSVEDREYENPAALLAEHEAILTAIRSGDPGRAAAEVRSHIEINARRLKEILAGRGRQIRPGGPGPAPVLRSVNPKMAVSLSRDVTSHPGRSHQVRPAVRTRSSGTASRAPAMPGPRGQRDRTGHSTARPPHGSLPPDHRTTAGTRPGSRCTRRGAAGPDGRYRADPFLAMGRPQRTIPIPAIGSVHPILARASSPQDAQ